jgi:hypothetical protein
MFTQHQTPMVFAYYMLATSTYGFLQANYAQDIIDAQALGIDGFAIAAGAWDSNYQTHAAAMFAAAQAASNNSDGTKFKLFMSAEVGGALVAADVQNMVNTFKGTAPATSTGVSSTNYYWFASKPFLTTSSGEHGAGSDSAAGQTFWASVFSGGFQVSFYPNFVTRRPTGGQINTDNPTYAEITSDFSTWWNSVASGLFYFVFDGLAINSDGSTGDLITSEEAYAQVMRDNSRIYLAGLNSYYAQTSFSKTSILAVERFGYEGIAAQWASIINTQKPPWVLLCTWNDIGESYITPADPSLMALNGAGTYAWPAQSPHIGFAKFHKSFISQFKTLGQPAIISDEVFYCYRTQPAAATPTATALTASHSSKTLTVTAASGGPIYLGQVLTSTGGNVTVSAFDGNGSGGTGTYSTFETSTITSRAFSNLSVTTAFFDLVDNIYVTTRLTAPAILRVISGGTTTDTAVPSGMTHTRVAFNAGSQEIKLIRGGSTLIDLTGEQVLSSIKYYNHNPTTGYGSYP